MKIISLIHEPDVMERFLRHFELCKQYPDAHPKRPKTPDPRSVVMEDFDDGWPGYENPSSSTTSLRRRISGGMAYFSGAQMAKGRIDIPGVSGGAKMYEKWRFRNVDGVNP
jgi:hypothetical protein